MVRYAYSVPRGSSRWQFACPQSDDPDAFLCAWTVRIRFLFRCDQTVAVKHDEWFIFIFSLNAIVWSRSNRDKRFRVIFSFNAIGWSRSNAINGLNLKQTNINISLHSEPKPQPPASCQRRRTSHQIRESTAARRRTRDNSDCQKGKNSPIRSEFDFEYPHGQIGAKGTAGEPKIASKVRYRRRGKNKKSTLMSSFLFFISYDVLTIVFTVLFSTG